MILRPSRKLFVLFTCLVALMTTLRTTAAEVRTLGVGDVVRIKVYGQPDMTTVTRISENNSINFPLIGDVRIGGMSAANAENLIESELSRKGFVKNAQVNLFVEQRFQTLNNTVTILGHVEKPGNYALEDLLAKVTLEEPSALAV